MSLLRSVRSRAAVMTVVAALCAVTLCAATLYAVTVGPAQAKGPDAADMPTVEDLVQRAITAKAAAAAAAREAARDPRKEVIAAYRDGKTALEEFTPLTDIINEHKDAQVQVYRNQASQAILLRFKTENMDDPQVRRTRARLALEILHLMKASSSDQVGLAIIQEVLQTWWATKIRTEIHFQAIDKWNKRSRAGRKMRSYLDRGGR